MFVGKQKVSTEQVKLLRCWFCILFMTLYRIQPNKRLEKWLLDRAAQIKTLSLESASESSRLAVRLYRALIG